MADILTTGGVIITIPKSEVNLLWPCQEKDQHKTLDKTMQR